MIKNIVFDVGKVLVSFEPEQYLKDLGYDEITRKIVMTSIFKSPLWDENDRGVMSTQELADGFVANAPEYETQIREAFKQVGGTIELMPHAVKWVEDLKARGYHLYIISNYGEYTYEQTEHKLKFLPYMDGIIFSFQYKMLKPKREIYETFLQEFQLKAEECVFIDDRMENIEGAEKAGIHGICFETIEQVKEDLKKYNVYA